MSTESILSRETLISKLKELVPFIFDHGKVDLKQFQNFMEEDIPVQIDKRFSLKWAGKHTISSILNAPATSILKKFDTKPISLGDTKHTVITGDNLEAMQLLSKFYSSKIGLIFSSIVHLEEDWETYSTGLNLLYPSLFRAKDLLHETGAIALLARGQWIFYLKTILNEIYGHENFIGIFIHEKQKTSDGKQENHEYIIVYAKNITEVKINRKKMPFDTKTYPYEDEYVKKRGHFYLREMNPVGITYGRTLDYKISFAKGTKMLFFNSEKRIIEKKTVEKDILLWPGGDKENRKRKTWRWSKRVFTWGLTQDALVLQKGADGKWKLRKKDYYAVKPDFREKKWKKVDRSTPFTTLVTNLTDLGDVLQKKLKIGHNFPSSLNIINHIFKIVSDDNITVLDLFAGTGDTALAVWGSNVVDQANRTFILVTPTEQDAQLLNRLSDYSKIFSKLDPKSHGFGFTHAQIDTSPRPN